MREILFRGKGKYSEIWYYGDLLQRTCYGETICTISYKNVRSDYMTPVVLPESIGQYTGLIDSNGEKIFEGDIVKCEDIINDHYFYAIVKFGNPNYGYNWGYQLVTDADVCKDILCWVEEDGARITIVGNIHDKNKIESNLLIDMIDTFCAKE